MVAHEATSKYVCLFSIHNRNGFEEDIDGVLAERGRRMIQKFWERIIKELYSFSCFYCAWNFFGRDVMGVLKALKITSESVTLADVNRLAGKGCE
ncbi:hypothetical protein OUZ56_000262 [Daphnia magna]|uniref:Uncharacterized protein n=1 Tax=Daphnia magna TaxID=35525 RepID=A0ABQ9ZZV7_9CRUS|nr:hypothetical protein OUZ56_000262 [Daphnia magna]